jgi:hypothetical protein
MWIPSICWWCIWHAASFTNVCTLLIFFFCSMGLTISASKSEVMLFTRIHERPPILKRIGSYVLPQTTRFKYLGIFWVLYGEDASNRWIGPGNVAQFVLRIWQSHIYLGLERVHYRTLRIAFGLMGSTPNNCLGVISGIPPLAERFPFLNFRYLVAAFYRLGHRWGRRLECWERWTGFCIKRYSDVLSLDIVPSEPFMLD